MCRFHAVAMRSQRNWQDYCSLSQYRECLSMGSFTLKDKEEEYGSRIDFVVIRSTTCGDRPAVPVPCYLTQLRRIRRAVIAPA